MKTYISTLFSTAMIGFVGVHTVEDIVLLSIGRFAPVPVVVMYALGLLTSWLVMGALLNKLLHHSSHH
jgi:hypothetical protein